MEKMERLQRGKVYDIPGAHQIGGCVDVRYSFHKINEDTSKNCIFVEGTPGLGVDYTVHIIIYLCGIHYV